MHRHFLSAFPHFLQRLSHAVLKTSRVVDMQLASNGVERRQVVALLALVGGVILFVYFTYFSYSSKQVAQFKVFRVKLLREKLTLKVL